MSCQDSHVLTGFAELALPLTAFAALNCALKSDMAMLVPQNQETQTVTCILGHARHVCCSKLRSTVDIKESREIVSATPKACYEE